jgi:cardiolipin synthase (CMP-forming)
MAVAADGPGSGRRDGPGDDGSVILAESPYTLPNAVTALRLLAAVPIVWLISLGWYQAALWLFVLAALSDGVDGYLAKRLNRQTALGAWLDPAADKVLLVSVCLVLAIDQLIPAWLLAVIVARDGLIGLGAAVLHRRSQAFRVQPLVPGKASTLVQIVLVVAVLLEAASMLALEGLVTGLIYATAVLALLSGAAYLTQGARIAFAAERAS